MRSKLLFFIAIITFTFTNTLYGQITVDDSFVTVADVETLITDVLIGGNNSCAMIDNVQKRTGIDDNVGQPNGIGSFDANGTNFPFASGVILSSGSINDAPGPNLNTQSAGTTGVWLGDTDLEGILGLPANGTNNASFIEFNFTPNIDFIDFNFIFMSEEYDNNFECQFEDAFAFILTDLTTGVTSNLAIVPTTGQPITPMTIRDLPNDPNPCPDVNPEFFGNYNLLVGGPNDVNPNNALTNFNGQTVILAAQSPVTPGTVYSIKLVVADQGDSAFDIAVFLEAGSFNIGVDLGDDLTIAGDTNACSGDTVTLDASANVAIGTTFQWQVFNVATGVFEDIPGEVGATLDVTVTGEYQVLVDAGTGCIGMDSVIIEFASAVATAPINQIACDDPSNDGFEVFDLDALIPFIIGTQDPLEVEVTFHTILNDAEMDMNPIPTPGAYNSDDATIFIRVESVFDDACFDTASFMLVVNERPTPVDPGPFVVCDNTNDGSDINGFVEFDLSTLNATILGLQDPTQFTLTYHIDANDALLDQSPLPLLFTNTVAGGQPIFVRLENDNFTDCFTVISFDLVVGALPVIINPAPLLTQCDDDTDGFSVFNLLQAGSLISADAANETFQFFDSLGIPIADPIAYTNSVVNNETIDVIVSTVNGCTRPAQLLLEVDTSQIPANFLLEYTACDTDGDLVSVFDFSDATPQVLALFPAGQLLTVTYYETLQEAQSEVNAIPNIDNYTNDITLTDVNGVQGIYVRVDGDTANDCIGLGIHVQLTVLPNPVLNTDVTDFVECSDDGVFGIFDLTSKDTEITGGNPDYAVSYYASLADYTAVPPIAIPNPTIYPNTSEPQTIYYSAVNTITGCSTFDEVNLFFDLFVNENPTTVLPTDLIICDEDGTPDGLTTMDLTVKNAEITGGFDPTVTVSYHLTLAGANVNDASIPDPTMFTNTTNIQIVFARVTDNITGCFSTEPLRIEVFLLPVPVVPADLEVCDVDNDGIFDFFILSDVDAEITGGDTSLTVVYYLTMDDANNAPVGGEIDNMMYINVNDPFFQT
ncbi:choice-of-anchor L domain-containing protein, partial [Dokdonia pacifica]